MLSTELEYCLNDAFQRAREERHEFITVEHLLLALLDTPTVIEGVDVIVKNILPTVEAFLGTISGQRS